MNIIPLPIANRTLASNSPSSGYSEAASPAGAAKTDFLKLLASQLRNQDPLKPMEDKEFITQLAQLNSLEQMTSMNARLGEFLSLQEMSQGSEMIGKVVEAQGLDGVISGVVEKLKVRGGRVLLLIGGKEVSLSDVSSIRNQTKQQ